MSGKIFLRRDGQLVPMIETAYETENILQELLAQNPDLLAGEQMNSEKPRRWLLLGSEIGVPDFAGGAARLSLDLLFVDQDAVPTLVEVKRVSDTRLRREVVAQMLDYAANAVPNFSVPEIRSKFEQDQADAKSDPALAVRRLRGEDGTDESAVEQFWSDFERNLQAGNIRLVFVADKVPERLQRIVQFLNKQMKPAEVLAVEIAQFTGDGKQTLVSRLFGMTSKGGTRSRPMVESYTEADFFPSLEDDLTPEEVKVARELLEWCKTNSPGNNVAWGGIGFGPNLPGGPDGFVSPFSVTDEGKVRISLLAIRSVSPFKQDDKRRELIAIWNKIPGVKIAPDKVNGKPFIPLSNLARPGNLEQFLGVVNWIWKEVRLATPGKP